MHRCRLAFPILVCLLGPSLLAADSEPGHAQFLSNCAFCHGVNGRGGRGPSLVSVRVTQNTSDDAIRNIVKNGIPGTSMPSFDMPKEDLDELVTYLRHLGNAGAKTTTARGDAVHGMNVYQANGCSGCHRIGDAGSIYGPELTRVGAARSPEYLRESVTNPSADIAPDYEGAEVVTKAGKRLRGVEINQDNFSIQLRLQDGRFAMFDKSELQSSEDLRESLMPKYNRLSPKDLDDLVAYLSSLNAEITGTEVKQTQGLH